MKKTIIALMALAGIASASSLNYGDAAFKLNAELMTGVIASYDFNGSSGSLVGNGLPLKEWSGGDVDTTFTLVEGKYANITANRPYNGNVDSLFNTGSFTISFDLISTATGANYGSILTLYSSTANGNTGWANTLSLRAQNKGNLYLALCAPNKDQAGFDGRKDGTMIDTGISSSGTNLTPTTITIVSAAAEVGASYGTLTLYINGEKQGSVDNWNAKDISALQFGDIFGGNNNPGTTYIDNLTVWDTALSKDAVAALVPEPTTATLSLLALAGLAARRRRR